MHAVFGGVKHTWALFHSRKGAGFLARNLSEITAIAHFDETRHDLQSKFRNVV